jgi:hypothetical protein
MCRALIAVFALILATASFGQTNFGPNAPLAGKSQYALAVSSATSLTVPSGATYAVVCAEGANVRYTVDGTTPTASTGMPLLQNSCISLQNAATLNKFQAIQQSSTATIDVSYYQ